MNAHHVAEFVRDRGQTVLSNLVELCAKHHRAVHDGGWAIVADEKHGWVFRRPDGTVFSAERMLTGEASTEALLANNREAGVDPGPEAITPAGLGERYVHEMTIWTLVNWWPTTPHDASSDSAASSGNEPDDTANAVDRFGP